MATTPNTMIYIVLSKYRIELLDKRSLGTPESLSRLLDIRDRPLEIRSVPPTFDPQVLYDAEDDVLSDEEPSRRRGKTVEIDLDTESRQKNDIFGFGQAVASLKHTSAAGTDPQSDVRYLEEFKRLNQDVLGAVWTQQYSFTAREKFHPGDRLVFHCNSILIYKQLDYGNSCGLPINQAELDAENKFRLVDWITQLTRERLVVDKIELVARSTRMHRDVQAMLTSFNQDTAYALLVQFIGSNVEAFLDTLNKLAEGLAQGFCLNSLSSWHSKYCK